MATRDIAIFVCKLFKILIKEQVIDGNLGDKTLGLQCQLWAGIQPITTIFINGLKVLNFFSH